MSSKIIEQDAKLAEIKGQVALITQTGILRHQQEEQ